MKSGLFRLNLRSAGMFSNVNEVVQQLHLAEQGGYLFNISWRFSCYLEDSVGPNPWLYYFKPCFNHTDWPADTPPLKGGTAVACSKENVITPRMIDGKCAPLLLPTDRRPAHRLIDQYIRLNDETARVVDSFARQFEGKRMIGLHIRGLGRNHGGATALRWQQGQQKPVIDYDRYVDVLEQHLQFYPDASIFVCSDSQTVIDEIRHRYTDKVIVYPSSRSDFGEMHARHKNNAGLDFSPYKLGLDVVAEAWLLAKTDLFIHGNSNVANFVLCKNPLLESVYVYAAETEEYIRVHFDQH